jgi:pseudaminic acid biosynthesis-associated methylase
LGKFAGDRAASEADRLEDLWAGDFGAAYAERTDPSTVDRSRFWRKLLDRFPAERILEVGCNTGVNLQAISTVRGDDQLVGVDVSHDALRRTRERLPGVDSLWARARSLPFRDGWFDLAFTTGVLIHQPEESLRDVMSEVVRVSRRYVLCGEYFSAETVEVPYRGERGALFKRDYGRLYLDNFPELHLLDEGYLSQGDGWDDVTWWLLEKSS